MLLLEIIALLMLKVLITTTADNTDCFLNYVPEKIRLNISCESSARRMIHIKWQVLFSLKITKKKNNFRILSAANLLSTLSLNKCG